MKKIIFSTLLFIIFLISLSILYLSIFGYETERFNEIVKSEIKKSNKKVTLDFRRISVQLDLKKFTLFVKFLDPKINYSEVQIPLMKLRADINLKSLLEKKIDIKRTVINTDFIDINKIKPLGKEFKIKEEDLKKIKKANFKINNLELEFDEKLTIKDNFNFNGQIKEGNIKISKEYEIKNLDTNFSYINKSFNLEKISWSFNDFENSEKEFFDGNLKIKKIKENFKINSDFKTQNISKFLNIPLLNYSFSKENTSLVKTKFSINKKNNIIFENIIIEDDDNYFRINNLHLGKDFKLINFDKIEIKTSIGNDINNEFKIINSDKIFIEGKLFDAAILIKDLTKDNNNNGFLKNFSKNVEIDLNKVLKGAKFPIKNFRLIGKINRGVFEKISAKSDFSINEHLDISLKKDKEKGKKVLEVYSDIATPLLTDYNFFKGLDGGNLTYTSEFDKKNSLNTLIINDFKLNDAPALAKLLTLADLKGLTDSLKGEGISFDTLSIKFETDPSTMTINEIFMIGPSISILIDGYVEKKTGLISLRGTLVPAKTLNKLVSRIPVVGDILVGKKVGEGVFGLSFKIKGQPKNLKTTVNPVKTLAPRFITRAVEAAKKKKTK
tara:strand:+ start:4940 stop:6772 length:1833 start_codon:yes stop_codon:yes gene_type:complete